MRAAAAARSRGPLTVALLLLAGAALAAAAEPEAAPAAKRDLFKDPEDGAFDASAWLLDRKGFLPVPILITEPAIGYGGGAALLFFRESIREVRERSETSGRLSPPDIYGGAVAATENDTTLLGAFGLITSPKEYWRWRGGVGRPDIHLDFYGAGGDLGTGEFKIAYNLDGWVSTQQVMRRLGESENFVGARWIWLDLDARFDESQPPPPPFPGERTVRSSGLGLFFEHDSRNNFFTATRGWKGYLESMFYEPELGSDEKYQTYRASAFGYAPVAKPIVLGGRVDTRAARGDVPFYQLPFIDMRGIPIARYQDENVALAEVEVQWSVAPRWTLIGFGGTGLTWGTSTDFGDADSASAWGVGFRRLVARRLGIYMGIDVAHGPEETAFYIQAGSAWR